MHCSLIFDDGYGTWGLNKYNELFGLNTRYDELNVCSCELQMRDRIDTTDLWMAMELNSSVFVLRLWLFLSKTKAFGERMNLRLFSTDK